MAGRPIIGIVGGIGSGKSTVARALAAAGCVVSDSDALARAAFEDAEIVGRLTARWGPEILSADGRVDRRAVARIVFGDPDERRWLEAQTHPWIEARRQRAFDEAPADAPALVIDAPLLLEAGLDRICTHILFVDTPRAVRLERVRETRGWDEAELARREESQLPLDEKRRRADYVVRNDKDPASLHEQIRSILHTLL